MPEERMTEEFRLKNIDKIRNDSIKWINRNELVSKRYKKLYKIL